MGFEYTKYAAGEMGQQLQTLTALLQDDSLVPNTRVGWFTTTFNSISRGSDVPFWIPWTPVLTHAHAHTYTNMSKYIPNM